MEKGESGKRERRADHPSCIRHSPHPTSLLKKKEGSLSDASCARGPAYALSRPSGDIGRQKKCPSHCIQAKIFYAYCIDKCRGLLFKPNSLFPFRGSGVILSTATFLFQNTCRLLDYNNRCPTAGHLQQTNICAILRA
jgi:hypothetical protein